MRIPNNQGSLISRNIINKKKQSEYIGKTVFIIENGCVPNRLASHEISNILIYGGFKIASNSDDADIIIFNSCGYCGDRINESKEILNNLISKQNNGCIIILTGCIDKIDPEIKNEYRCCKVVDIVDLPKYLGLEYIFDDLYISNCIIDTLETTNKYVYNVLTSKGCLGKCSYCAIKKARGSIKSKPISDILSEIDKGINDGFRKIVLWGDDFGAYGMDIGSSYIKLLKSIINAIPKNINYQMFLHRLNPQWIISSLEDVCEILAHNKIKLIYSPVQSGSPRILKLMNRYYNADDVIGSLKRLKEAFPELLLKTDIMVGFPTEDEEDVAETIRMIKAINFDEIVVFKYSGIKNTPAYLMKGHSSEDEKKKRLNRIWDSLPILRYVIESENGNYWITDKKDNQKVIAKINSYTGLIAEGGE